jgi:hypothetical protein
MDRLVSQKTKTILIQIIHELFSGRSSSRESRSKGNIVYGMEVFSVDLLYKLELFY